MILENMLPVVGGQLSARYHDHRRRYTREAFRLGLIQRDFPERRSRKRKPIPGVIDVADETEG